MKNEIEEKILNELDRDIQEIVNRGFKECINKEQANILINKAVTLQIVRNSKNKKR